MIETTSRNTNSGDSGSIESYYRFHSRIYDATRWSFLFGRRRLLEVIPDLPSRPRILEIGCGTGKNLERLGYYFPDASLVGVDLSDSMLDIASRKVGDSEDVQLIKARYGKESLDLPPFDLILFSYSLTMIGDDPGSIFEQVYSDLNARGYIGVVDFNSTPFGWFRRWMKVNHVTMDGHLLPLLRKYYRPVHSEVNKAYLGFWSYFTFLGSPK